MLKTLGFFAKFCSSSKRIRHFSSTLIKSYFKHALDQGLPGIRAVWRPHFQPQQAEPPSASSKPNAALHFLKLCLTLSVNRRLTGFC
jgi:hypothetical protein